MARLVAILENGRYVS